MATGRGLSRAVNHQGKERMLLMGRVGVPVPLKIEKNHLEGNQT